MGINIPFSIGANGTSDPTAGLKILGTYPTLAALEAAVLYPDSGDCYAVGAAEPYEIYFWSGTNNAWTDLGTMAGPNVISTSTDSTITGILKGSGGKVAKATAGTDYQAPLSASTATPQMDGTGSAGSSSNYSRGNHVHPTDTTRQAKITASGILKGDGNGGVSAAVAGADYIRYAEGSETSSFPPAEDGITTLLNGQKYAFSFSTSSRTLKCPVNGYCSGTMNVTGSTSGTLTFATGEIVVGETFPVSTGLYFFDAQNGIWHFAKAVKY